MKMKLKKGDNVIVVSGKDKGRTGAIVRVLPQENKVVIDGVAIAKRHQKGRMSDQAGQIIERPRAIDASNVMFLDPESKKGTRVGREVREGKSVRVSKKGGKVLA
jgi:large subunit ribosomal protein L24